MCAGGVSDCSKTNCDALAAALHMQKYNSENAFSYEVKNGMGRPTTRHATEAGRTMPIKIENNLPATPHPLGNFDVITSMKQYVPGKHSCCSAADTACTATSCEALRLLTAPAAEQRGAARLSLPACEHQEHQQNRRKN